MKKKPKSRMTAEDYARSERARAMLRERIAYYERRAAEREQREQSA